MTRTHLAPLLALLLLAPLAAVPAPAQDLGTTTFPNSGAADAQEPFLRGILLLHSFEYEDAREAFQEARRIDPDFALAAWGEAMTHNHPVWMQQDTEAARAALNALAPTLEDRLAKAQTEREQAYLRAADVLFFGDGSKEERDDAFAAAMGRLAEMYPDDLDATAFYALSLLGTAHEGRDFATYMRAAAAAERAFAQNPGHPGAAHYLIHSYDDPIHAPLGLPAARAYSEIAPAAAHALHMPSHIFVALGLWDDVVALNEASWAAADARVERKNLDVDQRSFHALWWLAYGYLQQGRYTDALRLMDTVTEDVARSGGSRATRTHQARMRAAHVVDAEQWDGRTAHLAIDTEGLSPATRAADFFVTGLATLKRGDRSTAEARLASLNDLVDDDKAAAIMADELNALLHLDAGDTDEALRLLDQAAAAEEALPFDFGPPMPVKPSHELYGEVLLELGRAEEARAHFEAALARAPRRARSLLGLARAARQAGDLETARYVYADLATAWHRADEDAPERSEVFNAADARAQ